jgi:hypothetical protein
MFLILAFISVKYISYTVSVRLKTPEMLSDDLQTSMLQLFLDPYGADFAI